MRTHGHRAARIDPLDLIHREEVAALDPARYGLTDENKRYNVDGIVWAKPVEESRDGAGEGEWWTLKEITRHLREIYVGRIAYEARLNLGYATSALTCFFPPVYALSVQDGTPVVFASTGISFSPFSRG